MYWKEFIHQCSEIGIGSLGIVVIISVFMGAVSTVQTAYQLVSPFIPLSIIAQIVRDTVILEFAPTLVCIVLAGVVGSKIASELGNMRVSEQIDALEIMGINTKTYLVLPKICCPGCYSMLVIILLCLGIWGGRLAGQLPEYRACYIFDKGLLRISYLSMFSLHCQSLHVCIYHFQYSCFLWVLCKRWRTWKLDEQVQNQLL